MALRIKPKGIEKYAEGHTTPLPALLEELTEATKSEMGRMAGMLTGRLEGTLLQILVASVRARRVLEIGMFTGFSAQMMAAALPEDGRLITCDINAKTIAFANEWYARSPHGHKIEVREGPALETLKTVEGPFDFIFIDADKTNYTNYYEAALPLLAPTGLIAVDNCLWSGRVLEPESDDDKAIVAFNDHVLHDDRVTNVLLTVRDGMMLIRKRS